MKKNVFSIVCLVFALCILFTGSAAASGATPGSSSDPLITQSYVDDRYDKLYDMILGISGSGVYISDGGSTMSTNDKNTLIEEIMYRVENMVGNSSTDTYEPVFANKGQILLGGEGTEIILRSGAAVGYVAGSNGISDVTTGSDILNGDDIKLNHLLIVPRNDGRGVRLTSDAWFLIKGTYTIIY